MFFVQLSVTGSLVCEHSIDTLDCIQRAESMNTAGNLARNRTACGARCQRLSKSPEKSAGRGREKVASQPVDSVYTAGNRRRKYSVDRDEKIQVDRAVRPLGG